MTREGLRMTLIIFGFFGFIVLAPLLHAAEEIAKHETTNYRDIFDQNIYNEGTNYLHLERMYRDLFHKKIRAANVNIYDEVPDAAFFTNRHARIRLSRDELGRGPGDGQGPDTTGTLTVYQGKFSGLHPGFFVQDGRGEKYLFKFDPADFLELATSAEIIGNRFFHAVGYNVPEESVIVFTPGQLVPGDTAEIVDDTGFKKKLTPERLQEYLLFVPQDAEGRFRASASKILPGENFGSMRFEGRHRKDPHDKLDHKDRREIRALQVFASWLNNYDVREGNTLVMVREENGKPAVREYLIDFNASLGAGGDGAKYPMFAHEHLLDYGEAAKAFFTLGLWEKPWQRRWREAGEQTNRSPAVGYFDNRYFDPGKYKTQLPHYAFKDLTRADGFWAAKIIMAFTDEDIRTIVQAGRLSRPEDADYIAKTLIERRNLIGKYWFDQAGALDSFELPGGELRFKDLALDYGFYPQEGTTYLVDILSKEGSRGQKIQSLELKNPSVDLGSLLQQHGDLDLLIRTLRPKAKSPSPYVLVELNAQKGIQGISHED